MNYIKYIPKSLLAALPLALLLDCLVFAQTGYAQKKGKVTVPKGIGPTYDSPANGPALKGLNTFLGFCVLVCIGFIVWGFVGWAKSTGGMREVGTSHPLVKSAVALVAIVVIFTINTFVTGWGNFVIS